ncbi:MAG: MbtH domain protein, partial [Bacteroidales bacterium]|nr:MbtH domain protein [Bacteroidales bacterium]NOQ27706.1 MbtH domain protein [Bacteroidales bacterium]
MEKELNELVVRLAKEQEVECARPEKTAEALKECIDRDYVH